MFKIGLYRYFNTPYTIELSLDSTAYLDLTVIITHLGRPDEPSDNTYEIVENYIKSHPERKIIHKMYNEVVYPAWHPHYKKYWNSSEHVFNLADFSNFGINIIKQYIEENNIDYNDVLFFKCDADIIEVIGEDFIKNFSDDQIRNKFIAKAPIEFFRIMENGDVMHRPIKDLVILRKRNDHLITPGKYFKILNFIQTQPYELCLYNGKIAKQRDILYLNKTSKSYFLHIDINKNYIHKRHFVESDWRLYKKNNEFVQKVLEKIFKK